jgi:L-histidine N-alpha-methyltransferase
LVTARTLQIDVHLTDADHTHALREDTRRGLLATPKEIAPLWFYDDLGSTLFEAITRIPAYYPTRREREILEREAARIARLTAADTLVELGSGSSEKTRLLLDALADAGRLRRFVPFDVSEPFLRTAAATLAAAYPGVEVHAVVGDFGRHLDRLPRGGRRLVAFLGSTIGNLTPAARTAFLRDVAAGLAPGDAFLVGTDLVKDESRLVAAYDDPAGVTAAFNRNALSNLNRTLGANFDPERFRHVARWDAEHERIEMLLVADSEQVVKVPDLDLKVRFAAGEALRTEISTKFRRDGVTADLAAAGLRMTRWWTDQHGDFALSLSVPA